jgi:hypothetical protein
MESVFDKNTNPHIKVVDALKSVKTERARMSGCLLVGLLLIGFIAYVLLSNPKQDDIWYWLTVLLLVAMVYLLFYTTKQAVADIRLRQKLDTQGIQVQATVVGHEVEEHEGNPNVFIVYYQFRSDFVVKYADFTTDKRFFSMPVGGKLSVRYLPENPEINGLVS